MNRTWKNIELRESADKFREFLRENKIKYETSDAGFGYIHFEVFVSDEETAMCNSFMNSVVRR